MVSNEKGVDTFTDKEISALEEYNNYGGVQGSQIINLQLYFIL